MSHLKIFADLCFSWSVPRVRCHVFISSTEPGTGYGGEPNLCPAAVDYSGTGSCILKAIGGFDLDVSYWDDRQRCRRRVGYLRCDQLIYIQEIEALEIL